VAVVPVAIAAFIGRQQALVPLTPGMVIAESVTIRSGTYHISASADLRTPAITVRGHNITVDFNGATLRGSAIDAEPDTFAGDGVLVDGGGTVTIKNAKIHGYKVGILARRSPDLISDDGVRVWVDDALVVDAWEPHESRVDRAPIAGGRRRFKVLYYEIGGFAALRFDIQRK
jgi:hypothetical protein